MNISSCGSVLEVHLAIASARKVERLVASEEGSTLGGQILGARGDDQGERASVRWSWRRDLNANGLVHCERGSRNIHDRRVSFASVSLFDGVEERLKYENPTSRLAAEGTGDFYEREKKVYDSLVRNNATGDAVKMFLNGDYVLLHLLFLLEVRVVVKI